MHFRVAWAGGFGKVASGMAGWRKSCLLLVGRRQSYEQGAGHDAARPHRETARHEAREGLELEIYLRRHRRQSPILITGAILGQMKLTKPQVAKAAELFGLSKSEQVLLNEVPMRGTPMPPTDPLIYRFFELIMINGPALKALIEEEFGDGIMSAIDLDMDIARKSDPKGDRVMLSMSGKFLPYKCYGATGNALALGLKEE